MAKGNVFQSILNDVFYMHYAAHASWIYRSCGFDSPQSAVTLLKINKYRRIFYHLIFFCVTNDCQIN